MWGSPCVLNNVIAGPAMHKRARAAMAHAVRTAGDVTASHLPVLIRLQVDVKGPGAHPIWRFLLANQPNDHGYPPEIGERHASLPSCRCACNSMEHGRSGHHVKVRLVLSRMPSRDGCPFNLNM